MLDKKKYFIILRRNFIQFLLVFVSVIMAYFLAEWSKSRSENLSEEKLLIEIKNGITSDYKDFENNINGHNYSLNGITLFRNWINNKPFNNDSVAFFYRILFRNFSPVINKTGYESLKANNISSIQNDSLRFQIITLYDYHHKIIELLENQNQEMQDFANFYKETNELIHPFMNFDEKSNFVGLNPPIGLNENNKKKLLSFLWRIEFSKTFKIIRYKSVMEHIAKLDQNIEKELKNR